MKQKLDPKSMGIALASITFILSILCLLAILFLGDSSMNFFNLFFHGIDLNAIKIAPDIIQGLIGTIIVTVIGFVVGYIFALIYNKYS